MKFRSVLYLLVFTLSILPILGPIFAGVPPKPMEKLRLSDEDIANLEAMGFAREEALEMAKLIESMTPEEQNALAQVGQQVAKDMSNSGLNPNDPEQMMNFLSSQGKAAPTAPVTPKIDTKTSAPFPPINEPAPHVKTELVKNPRVSTDIQLLIKEILDHIESLRQKASTTWKMSKKIEVKFKNELDELVFYLNSINKKELIPYISSQEFSHLYSTLEGLHKALITYEPRIAVFPFFEEDEIINPYKVLGISTKANKKEIDSTYKKLKDKYDPQIIVTSEKFRKLNKKEQKKLLIQSKLAFDEVKEAYDSLSNPKEKAAIDKELMEFEFLQETNEQLSDNNFEVLINILQEAIYFHKLVKEIQSVLQKYAPEEKKKSDEWEKSKQTALEASKKEYESAVSRGRTGKIINVPIKEDVGEKYWSQFRVADTPRASYQPFIPNYEPSLSGKAPFSDPFGPSMASSKGSPSGGAPDKKDGGTKSAPSRDGGGGGGGPKDKGDSQERKETPEKGKKDAEMSEIDKLELGQYMHLKDLENISKLLKDSEHKKDSLQNIFKEQLQKYLITDVPEDLKKAQTPADSEEEPKTVEDITPPVIKKIDDFVKKVHLPEIEADFNEIAKKVSSPKSKKDALKNVWKEVKNKYGESIMKLGKLTEVVLEPNLWQNHYGRAMNLNQEDFHLLRYKDLYRDETHKKKIFALKGKQLKVEPFQEGYLGFIKLTIENIINAYEKINKSLGIDNRK